MVSSKNFNVDSVEDRYDELVSEDGALMNPAKDYLFACGSVLKPVIGEVLLDNGKENYTVNDTGMITIEGSGETIRNAGYAVHGNINLDYAMKVSSNVFFISAANEIGTDEMNSRYKELKIGEIINTDFGKISSQMTLRPNSNYDLAYAAIGQNVQISTIHLAMIMKGITTGEVVTPYMVKKIIKDDTVTRSGVKEVLTKTSASATTINKMKSILHNCAESYGLSEEICGVEVMAKTGTAEVETKDGNKNIATLLIAFPVEDPQYFIAIQSRNTDEWGKSLTDIGVELIYSLQ